MFCRRSFCLDTITTKLWRSRRRRYNEVRLYDMVYCVIGQMRSLKHYESVAWARLSARHNDVAERRMLSARYNDVAERQRLSARFCWNIVMSPLWLRTVYRLSRWKKRCFACSRLWGRRFKEFITWSNVLLLIFSYVHVHTWLSNNVQSQNSLITMFHYTSCLNWSHQLTTWTTAKHDTIMIIIMIDS